MQLKAILDRKIALKKTNRNFRRTETKNGTGISWWNVDIGRRDCKYAEAVCRRYIGKNTTGNKDSD
mgnify:CR=1 FL=1